MISGLKVIIKHGVTMMKGSKMKVGDIVQIKETATKRKYDNHPDNPLGWGYGMSNLVGKKVKVIKVEKDFFWANDWAWYYDDAVIVESSIDDLVKKIILISTGSDIYIPETASKIKKEILTFMEQ